MALRSFPAIGGVQRQAVIGDDEAGGDALDMRKVGVAVVGKMAGDIVSQNKQIARHTYSR